jgi:hypothetical protein
LISEKNSAVNQASVFLEKATIIQSLLSEKTKHLKSIESIRENQKNISIECGKSKFFSGFLSQE